ncbi:MAG: DUF2786 domain-containing protein [Oligoflexales bacterium]|nr:DUF2786 domain-containing protein [Oligoflexales bacterium]
MTKPPFQQQLITIWTKQLYLEHERICFGQNIELSPVTILIRSSKSQLGGWDANVQCIFISLEFIQNHCWSKVIEVLKHEMAHQLVSEYLFESDAHGQGFKRACKILGVASWASKASVHDDDLQTDTLASMVSEEEERMLRKAKKLLALAQSGNQFEASEAMNKAQHLYERYHLSSLKQMEKPPYGVSIIKHHKSRTELYQTMIGSILVKYFYVKVIHSQLFDAKACKEHKVIEIIGNQRHIELAEYVYWFIYNHLPRFWQDYKKTSGKTGMRSRNQYYQGVVTGFGEQLAKSQDRRQRNNATDPEFTKSLQLIETEDKRLCEFMRSRYPRLRTEGYRAQSRDKISYEAGIKKGLSLTIHAGIKEQKNAQKRLLGD